MSTSISRIGSSSTAQQCSRSFSTTRVTSRIAAEARVGEHRRSPNYLPHKNGKPKRGVPDVSRKTIRTLISLHHASASFMPTADAAAVGFENAFRHTIGDPVFKRYESWRSSTIQRFGSSNQLIERDNPLRFDDLGSEFSASKGKYWQTFVENEEPFGSNKDTVLMTERQRQVKEALYGTWERGGLGMRGSKPGFEGVLEYLGAKGVSVGVTARQWEQRHEESPDLGNVVEQPEDAKSVEGPEADEGRLLESGETLLESGETLLESDEPSSEADETALEADETALEADETAPRADKIRSRGVRRGSRVSKSD